MKLLATSYSFYKPSKLYFTMIQAQCVLHYQLQLNLEASLLALLSLISEAVVPNLFTHVPPIYNNAFQQSGKYVFLIIIVNYFAHPSIIFRYPLGTRNPSWAPLLSSFLSHLQQNNGQLRNNNNPWVHTHTHIFHCFKCHVSKISLINESKWIKKVSQIFFHLMRS